MSYFFIFVVPDLSVKTTTNLKIGKLISMKFTALFIVASVLMLFSSDLSGQDPICGEGFTSKNNACLRLFFPHTTVVPDTILWDLDSDGVFTDTLVLSVDSCGPSGPGSNPNDGWSIYGVQGGSCTCQGNYNQGESGVLKFSSEWNG